MRDEHGNELCDCHGIPATFCAGNGHILDCQGDCGYPELRCDGMSAYHRLVSGTATDSTGARKDEAPNVGLRAAFAKVLTDWGIDALTSDPPHGWRCEYPESYGKGPCDCVSRLLDDFVEAVYISGALDEYKEATDAAMNYGEGYAAGLKAAEDDDIYGANA